MNKDRPATLFILWLTQPPKRYKETTVVWWVREWKVAGISSFTFFFSCHLRLSVSTFSLYLYLCDLSLRWQKIKNGGTYTGMLLARHYGWIVSSYVLFFLFELSIHNNGGPYIPVASASDWLFLHMHGPNTINRNRSKGLLMGPCMKSQSPFSYSGNRHKNPANSSTMGKFLIFLSL